MRQFWKRLRNFVLVIQVCSLKEHCHFLNLLMFQETFVYDNDENDRISFHCRCRKYYFRAINCHAPLTLITGKLRKKDHANYFLDFQRYFTLEWSAYGNAYFRQNTSREYQIKRRLLRWFPNENSSANVIINACREGSWSKGVKNAAHWTNHFTADKRFALFEQQKIIRVHAQ